MMLRKIAEFWHDPLYTKIHRISTTYYKLKARCFYRGTFAHFGKGSFIRKPTLIMNPEFMRIGDNVSIRDGVRLEVVRSTQDRVPSLSIGSNTNVEQNVHIVCHNRVQIGSNVSIAGHSAIVDVTHPFHDVTDLKKIGSRILDENSYVEIDDGSFVGFGVVILPNVRIGRCAVIGANAVVVSDIPAYSVATGVPARVIKQFDFDSQQWIGIARNYELSDC
jgi:acetyltransferase-like isoleucine patch superfamily enzyme